ARAVAQYPDQVIGYFGFIHPVKGVDYERDPGRHTAKDSPKRTTQGLQAVPCRRLECRHTPVIDQPGLLEGIDGNPPKSPAISNGVVERQPDPRARYIRARSSPVSEQRALSAASRAAHDCQGGARIESGQKPRTRDAH